MTKAQFRMVKRIIAGEKLPVSNYRRMHATIGACARKLWISEVGEFWGVTWRGRKAIEREVEP